MSVDIKFNKNCLSNKKTLIHKGGNISKRSLRHGLNIEMTYSLGICQYSCLKYITFINKSTYT